MEIKRIAKQISEKVNIFRMSDESKIFMQEDMTNALKESKCPYYILTPIYLIKYGILKSNTTTKNKSGNTIKLYVFEEKNKPVEYAVFLNMIKEILVKAHIKREEKLRLLKQEKIELKENEFYSIRDLQLSAASPSAHSKGDERSIKGLRDYSDLELIKEVIDIRELDIHRLYKADYLAMIIPDEILIDELHRRDVKDGENYLCAWTDKQLVEELRKRGVNVKATITTEL